MLLNYSRFRSNEVVLYFNVYGHLLLWMFLKWSFIFFHPTLSVVPLHMFYSNSLSLKRHFFYAKLLLADKKTAVTIRAMWRVSLFNFFLIRIGYTVECKCSTFLLLGYFLKSKNGIIVIRFSSKDLLTVKLPFLWDFRVLCPSFTQISQWRDTDTDTWNVSANSQSSGECPLERNDTYNWNVSAN